MKFQWVTYTEGPPILADFLTTAGQGPTLCVDKSSGEVYYLDGLTPTRTELGPSGYQRGDHLVLSTAAIVGNIGDLGGTAFNSYFQIHSTDPLMTGIQITKWGNDNKGIQNWFGKIRGTGIGDYAPLVLGDRVITDNYQGSGLSAQTGHVGYKRWSIDKTPTNNGELGGRYQLATGTGFHNTEDPIYYGIRIAVDVNCLQQVWLPGQLGSVPASNGTNYGAILTLGPGGTAAGQAPLRFDLTGTALLTTPVAGVVEATSTGLYYTLGSGSRVNLTSGGGGGSVNSGSTTIDFGTFPGSTDASVVVTGQSGIVAGSVVTAWPNAIATADHSAMEHIVDPPRFVAGDIVPGVGFTIYAFTQNTRRHYGQYSTAWTWS